MKLAPTVIGICILTTCISSPAADWNQWRGPNRDGVDPNSPKLIDSLPKVGVKPLWISSAKELPGTRSGGWSSPIIAGQHVFLYTHRRVRKTKGRLPKRKFPYLPPAKRKGMSDEEYAEYERKRRDEEEQRAKNFRHDEIVYCLDRNTGKPIWKKLVNNQIYSRFSQSGSPIVADGRLIVLGAGRIAYCLDAKSGDKIWERRLPGKFRDEYLPSSFVVANDRAIILADNLFGLDTKSGKIIWTVESKSPGRCFSSPVVWIHKSKAYAICNMAGGNTVCVQANSGKQVWTAKTLGGHATPIVIGDRLITYGSSRKRGLRCFDLSLTGAKQAWMNRRIKDPGSSPVIIGDHVYVQGDRRLTCVSLANGKSRWTTTLDLNRPRYTSLIAADGKIFYAFDNVICFRATPKKFESLMNAKIDEKGLLANVSVFRANLKIDELETTAEGQRKAERLWRRKFGRNAPLPCASPAIADGKIYLRLKNGIACYDLRQ